jgi:hypothetical protein
MVEIQFVCVWYKAANLDLQQCSMSAAQCEFCGVGLQPLYRHQHIENHKAAVWNLFRHDTPIHESIRGFASIDVGGFFSDQDHNALKLIQEVRKLHVFLKLESPQKLAANYPGMMKQLEQLDDPGSIYFKFVNAMAEKDLAKHLQVPIQRWPSEGPARAAGGGAFTPDFDSTDWQKWFHGRMTHKDVKALLHDAAPGSFILYTHTDSRYLAYSAPVHMDAKVLGLPEDEDPLPYAYVNYRKITQTEIGGTPGFQLEGFKGNFGTMSQLLDYARDELGLIEQPVLPAAGAVAASMKRPIYARECKHPGCTNQSTRQGLCYSHGAYGTCTFSGCTKVLRSGEYLCANHRHPTCTYPGCTTIDQLGKFKHGRCYKHRKSPDTMGYESLMGAFFDLAV